jgi:hypothetical protein
MNGSNKNLIALLILDMVILIIAVGVAGFRYMTLTGSAVNVELSKPLSTLKQLSAGPSQIASKPQHDADYGSENDLSDLPGVNEVPEEPAKAVPSPQTAAKQAAIGKAIRRIGFTFFNSKSKRVEVIGDFNNWTPAPMQKINAKQWSLAVPIVPGDYAYNFVVDGRPITDPNNPKICNVGRGFTNSLLRVKSLQEP